MSNKDYSKVKLIAELNATIDKELSKPVDEADSDLVDECMAFLDEISGDKYTPDENEKQKRLAELSKLISQKCNPKQSMKKHHIKLRTIFAAAACVLFLMAASVFVCAATWKISPGDVLVKWGKAIFDMPYNEEIEESGFTFIRPDGVETYSTLDDFAQSEQFGILLPHWLPENIQVESVVYINSSGYEQILFQFNDEALLYSVYLYQNIDYDERDIIDKGKINDIEYYTLESEYGVEVRFNYKENSYSIVYNDINIILSIIKKLK